jgi:hypothetical protein
MRADQAKPLLTCGEFRLTERRIVDGRTVE